MLRLLVLHSVAGSLTYTPLATGNIPGACLHVCVLVWADDDDDGEAFALVKRNETNERKKSKNKLCVAAHKLNAGRAAKKKRDQKIIMQIVNGMETNWKIWFIFWANAFGCYTAENTGQEIFAVHFSISTGKRNPRDAVIFFFSIIEIDNEN